MRWIPPQRAPWMLLAALAVGAAIGVAPVDRVAAALGVRPGFGNLVAVNLVLPSAAVAAAFAFPRVRTAMACGALLAVGFAIARLLRYEARIWRWDFSFLAAQLNPIVVAAGLGCAVIGGLGAAATRPFRRVGWEPHTPSCPRCCHALAAQGAANPFVTCPECGGHLPRLEAGNG